MTGHVDPRATRLLDDLLLQTDAVARLVDRGKPAYDQDEFLRYAGEGLLVRLGEVVARLDPGARAARVVRACVEGSDTVRA